MDKDPSPPAEQASGLTSVSIRMQRFRVIAGNTCDHAWLSHEQKCSETTNFDGM